MLGDKLDSRGTSWVLKNQVGWRRKGAFLTGWKRYKHRTIGSLLMLLLEDQNINSLPAQGLSTTAPLFITSLCSSHHSLVRQILPSSLAAVRPFNQSTV